jgi:hypothetical protein
MTTKKKTQGATKGKAEAEELDAFAHHFAEVLRIARTNPSISTRFFNDLAEAWCDFENTISDSDTLHHDEEIIRVALRFNAKQKGGAQ